MKIKYLVLIVILPISLILLSKVFATSSADKCDDDTKKINFYNTCYAANAIYEMGNSDAIAKDKTLCKCIVDNWVVTPNLPNCQYSSSWVYDIMNTKKVNSTCRLGN